MMARDVSHLSVEVRVDADPAPEDVAALNDLLYRTSGRSKG